MFNKDAPIISTKNSFWRRGVKSWCNSIITRPSDLLWSCTENNSKRIYDRKHRDALFNGITVQIEQMEGNETYKAVPSEQRQRMNLLKYQI